LSLGIDGSNPSPSSGESCANLIPLRKALGGDRDFIQTDFGRGYRFTGVARRWLLCPRVGLTTDGRSSCSWRAACRYSRRKDLKAFEAAQVHTRARELAEQQGDREVDGRARAVFLMYQAIDRNSPFLDRRSQNPGSPGVLSLEP
jgi:hypothetical protein